MRLREDGSEFSQFNDSEYVDEREDESSLARKRMIKKRLEEKLESRRLRHELDDFDDDEDHWDLEV